MPKKPPIAGVYTVSCMDPRERIVEASHAKQLHLIDSMDRGQIHGEVAYQLHQARVAAGLAEVGRRTNFYRNARGGGGWSLDSRDDLEIIKENKLPVLAFYSGRHSNCAAVGVMGHLRDHDIAIMIVEDCAAVGLMIPPVFRAHLEIHSKNEQIEQRLMDLEALVAHAMLKGPSPRFPERHGYSVTAAAKILGLQAKDKGSLSRLAERIDLSPKGLLKPSSVELDDQQVSH